jgi:hypothetical protein
MKVILYTSAHDPLCVVRPVINTYPERELITEDQALERAKKDIPADATDVQIVDESAIPTDRTFRNAWKAGNGCVEHDMEKCREIHRNRLREIRKGKLLALDTEYMRADELGDLTAKKAIAAKKQELRDATQHPAIDAAQTPEELKLAIPECLK